MTESNKGDKSVVIQEPNEKEKTSKGKSKKKQEEVVVPTVTPKDDFMECFHQEQPICVFPKTNPIEKPNIFDVFRPPPRVYLGYTISQTDAKLDAGITKIHLQHTTADYILPPPGYVFPKPPPPPPPPKVERFKFSTGRGPCWKFLDEIWREKQEALQKIYRMQLQTRIAHRKRTERAGKLKAHKAVTDMVGPEWFIELSPYQLVIVENLQLCMAIDLKLGTTEYTQENLGLLGVTLRPTHKHVKIALNHCCRSPVEFLLVLYQLMNPERNNYSLNDQLLLSAVVHLTMPHTLKEMHVRIPSPPREFEKVNVIVKKQKVKRYSSPYLKPFTFIPEPRKHTGLYKNNHRQYPESPYFTYPRNPPTMENKGDDSDSDSADQQIMEELEVAQELYNNLAKSGEAPRLQKPSIYPSCEAAMAMFGFTKPPKKIKRFALSIDVQIGAGTGPDGRPLTDVMVKVTVDFDHPDLDKEPVEEEPLTTCICGPRKPSFENLDEEDDSSEETSEETSEEATCTCCKPCEISEEPTDCDCILSEISEEATDCGCKEFEKSEEDDDYRCRDCGGVILDPSSEEEEKSVKCECGGLKRKLDKLITLEKPESTECTCKEEVQRQIDTALCQCERCKEDRDRALKKRLTYIISGTKITDSGEPIKIISGVKEATKCDCLRKYQAFVKKFEDVEMRFKAQAALKSAKQKFIITGVSRGPDGKPVFQLQGVAPKPPCDCQKGLKEHIKEELRIANMPRIPLGRLKYIISGVQQTPNGNVYVISGVLPIEDCKCMAVYYNFKEKHTPCIEAYEEYVNSIQNEINEYMNDIISEGKWPQDVCDCTPKFPMGKFIISGVKESPEGPVYIIEGLIPEARRPNYIPSNEDKPPEDLVPDNNLEEETRKKRKSKGRVCTKCGELDELNGPCLKCKVEEESDSSEECTCCPKENKTGCCQVEKEPQKTRKELISKEKRSSKEKKDQSKGVCTCCGLQKNVEVDLNACNCAPEQAPGCQCYPPQNTCSCKEDKSQKLCECGKKTKAGRSPKLQKGKFIISGVKESPEGPIYIIDGLIPEARRSRKKKKNQSKGVCPDCGLQKDVQVDLNACNCAPEQAAGCQCCPPQNTCSCKEDKSQKFCECGKKPKGPPPCKKCAPKEEEPGIDLIPLAGRFMISGIHETPKGPVYIIGGVLSRIDLDEAMCSWKLNLKVEVVTDNLEKRMKRVCICDPDNPTDDQGPCKCTNPPNERKPKPELRRFIILETFSCDIRKHKRIIKKAMEMLADDGYPLAKLPNCYKLPHFKLWMEARCGKYWTQEDRLEYMKYSRAHWRHTNICERTVKLPVLGITKEEGATYTWAQAGTVKDMVAEKINDYYRKLRQASVDVGREYFPTIFAYEFPTPSFRECYFAYTPSKESDVLAYRTWQPFEIKDFHNRQSCL